jgi:hypothetical protein
VHTDVKISEDLTPPHSCIRVPAVEIRFVPCFAGNAERGPQTTVAAGESALSESGHDVEVHCAPFAQQGELHHRLTELVLPVSIVDQICLVDHIHKVDGFRDTPEDFAHTEK